MGLRANTAENAKLNYEAGQSKVANAAMTDSGDHTQFTSSPTSGFWSDRAGYEPVVRPNGLITGGIATPDNALVNNVVDITALTCYLAGVETSVGAGSLTASRAVNPATHRITSLTVNNAGTLVAVAGTEGVAFSETRAAAGGPPLIAVDSIEIGQVRLSSFTDAVVDEDEIFQVPGTHQERYDYPLWETNYGPGEGGDPPGGSITFQAALPLTHTGPVAKAVYCEYYEPVFAELRPVSDVVPPDESHSVSSTQVYGGTIAARSSSIGQGSFTAYLQNGVNDPVVKLKDEVLWFKFYPDRYKTLYIAFQGKLGVSRTFPAGGASMTASCTVSPEEKSVELES